MVPRQRAATVMKHLSDIKAALLIANNRGRYIVANRAAARLTGYAGHELLQLSVWDLTPPVKQAVGRRLWRAFLVRGRMGGTYLLRRKDGQIVGARYAAIANVLPGIHVSLLSRPSRSARQTRRAHRR
jgi:PAS domain S-box-containing protein